MKRKTLLDTLTTRPRSTYITFLGIETYKESKQKRRFFIKRQNITSDNICSFGCIFFVGHDQYDTQRIDYAAPDTTYYMDF